MPLLLLHNHFKKTTAVLLLILLPLTSMAANQAPDWTLKDASGQNVSLTDYRGKVLILHFWATWCPYCKRLQPGLDKLYLQYQDQGVELLGISFREDEGTNPQRVIIERGHSFKTLLNGEKVAGQYQVLGTPTTFIIDQKGEVRAVTNVSNPKELGFEKILKELLN